MCGFFSLYSDVTLLFFFVLFPSLSISLSLSLSFSPPFSYILLANFFLHIPFCLLFPFFFGNFFHQFPLTLRLHHLPLYTLKNLLKKFPTLEGETVGSFVTMYNNNRLAYPKMYCNATRIDYTVTLSTARGWIALPPERISNGGRAASQGVHTSVSSIPYASPYLSNLLTVFFESSSTPS